MNKKVCFLICWFFALCVVACHLIEKRRNVHLSGTGRALTKCSPKFKPRKEFQPETSLPEPFSHFFKI